MIYEWYICMTYSKGNHAALMLGSGYPTCGHKFASFWEICKAIILYFLFFISYIRNLKKNLVLVWLLGCCSMFSICLKTILNMLVTGYTKKILLYHFAIWFKLGSNLILVEYWSNLSIRLMQNIPHLARHDHEWVSVNNDIDRDYSRVHHIIHTTSLHLLESIWMRILHFAESIFTPEVYRKSVHVAQISYHIVHKTEAQG